MSEENNPPADTKVCEACDAVIGKSEKDCPKCGVNFEELEDNIAAVEKTNAILAKRKAKETPAPTPEAEVKPKGSKLRSLGSILRKGK